MSLYMKETVNSAPRFVLVGEEMDRGAKKASKQWMRNSAISTFLWSSSDIFFSQGLDKQVGWNYDI